MSHTPSPIRIPAEPPEIRPWLERFIETQEAESGSLEYKNGVVLNRENRNQPRVKEDISKDASAMANANGGIIIYGIKETGPGERRAAEGFSPVTDPDVTRETIDQILSTHVRPPLEGLRVEEVVLSAAGAPLERCFVVEIPKAGTAHQAADKRYWRRRTLTTDPMEHYEIQEVMNRQIWPTLEVAVTMARAS